MSEAPFLKNGIARDYFGWWNLRQYLIQLKCLLELFEIANYILQPAAVFQQRYKLSPNNLVRAEKSQAFQIYTSSQFFNSFDRRSSFILLRFSVYDRWSFLAGLRWAFLLRRSTVGRRRSFFYTTSANVFSILLKYSAPPTSAARATSVETAMIGPGAVSAPSRAQRNPSTTPTMGLRP